MNKFNTHVTSLLMFSLHAIVIYHKYFRITSTVISSKIHLFAPSQFTRNEALYTVLNAAYTHVFQVPGFYSASLPPTPRFPYTSKITRK